MGLKLAINEPILQATLPNIKKQIIGPVYSIDAYLQAATSQNTRQAYRQDIKHFMVWGGFLPTNPEVILRYLQHHAEVLNPRTLSRRLTALKHWHTYQGFTDPTAHPQVRKTLTGIQNIHGRPKDKAPALTLEQLKQLVQYLRHQKTLRACRDSALLQVGFLGAFRRSELAQMRWEQVTFVQEGVEILIPRSKTDQTGEGQVCAIPYGDQLLCAVKALQAWQEASNCSVGFIFQNINRHGQLSQAALAPSSINLIIKQVAQACGLPQADKLSGHSLRRGFATATSRQGASFVAIMRHGRWRHEKTVLGYIEEGQRFVENAAGLLLRDSGKK